MTDWRDISISHILLLRLGVRTIGDILEKEIRGRYENCLTYVPHALCTAVQYLLDRRRQFF